jgi:SnoaL-like domain
MSASLQALADTLEAAFDRRDAAVLASVLAADVRWGSEEETPETCHSDREVLAWYERLRAQGVEAQVEEVVVRERAVVLGLLVSQPGEAPERDPMRVWQTFAVADGLVVEIRGYPERDEALAFADRHPAA